MIGANCGNGIAGYVPVCERLHAASRLPIWIKANAGLPEINDGQVVYSHHAGGVRQLTSRSLSPPAPTYIGGCCGTSPDYIRVAREALEAVER